MASRGDHSADIALLREYAGCREPYQQNSSVPERVFALKSSDALWTEAV